MKRGCIWAACLIWWAATLTSSPAQVGMRVAYTLIEGSYLVDDCPICEVVPDLSGDSPWSAGAVGRAFYRVRQW